MASAGRVLPINKGTYNSATTYAPLDIVYYNEGTYCCKKACTNVTPAEGEYWQKWVDVSDKVDKVNGKGLSTNDFTDAEKAKADNAVLWSERKGYVGKNLLNNTATSKTFYGLSYTINSDKSVTLEAGTTSTAEATFDLFPATGYAEKILPEGQYLISTGGVGNDNVFLFISRKKGASGTPNYIGVTTTEYLLTVDYSQYDYYKFSIHQKNGYTIPTGGITFYPMIRKTSISDSTYEPYLESNEELANSKLSIVDIAAIHGNVDDTYIDSITASGVSSFYFVSTNLGKQGWSTLITLNLANVITQFIKIEGGSTYERHYNKSTSTWSNWG